MDHSMVDSVPTRVGIGSKTKIIKRYSNRKLYDTERSAYVVLNDIAEMIRAHREVQIIDNETKSDITSATLTQIIFGAEKRVQSPVSLNVLKSIIMEGDGSFSNFLVEKGLCPLSKPSQPAHKIGETPPVRQTSYMATNKNVVRNLRGPAIDKNFVAQKPSAIEEDPNQVILPTSSVNNSFQETKM